MACVAIAIVAIALSAAEMGEAVLLRAHLGPVVFALLPQGKFDKIAIETENEQVGYRLHNPHSEEGSKTACMYVYLDRYLLAFSYIVPSAQSKRKLTLCPIQ